MEREHVYTHMGKCTCIPYSTDSMRHMNIDLSKCTKYKKPAKPANQRNQSNLVGILTVFLD